MKISEWKRSVPSAPGELRAAVVALGDLARHGGQGVRGVVVGEDPVDVHGGSREAGSSPPPVPVKGRPVARRPGYTAARDPSGARSPVYDSARQGLLFVEEAKALWRYRHLVSELVARDIKVRYKRSVLGVAWSMLSPLLSMVALTIAFSALLKQQIANYPAYFLAGSVFWTFFSQATRHAASLTSDASEISRRVYVPRSVFVASAVGRRAREPPLHARPAPRRSSRRRATRSTPRGSSCPSSILTGDPLHGRRRPRDLHAGLALRRREGDVHRPPRTWFFLTPIVYTPAILAPKYRLVVRLQPDDVPRRDVPRAASTTAGCRGRTRSLFSLLAGVSSLVVGWLFYAWKIEDYGTRH